VTCCGRARRGPLTDFWPTALAPHFPGAGAITRRQDADALSQNSPGPLPPEVPAFIAKGTADFLVRPSVTTAYVNALCRNGSKVRFNMFQRVGHAFIARDVADNAVSWIAARFDGPTGS
jgi:hypothetical protein